ncbi:hypothetical protein A2276_06060 [candidate division WOR-1 bacterium RIFOXYA12_FULL_43_27]|uniref:NAD-dependent epimerase/dehydratase domain-containing protein n=1 Tax=candidate division WOR-1 bacterium RIFOXYC2_FULL_46_14 TaxID=1802587 RepID=A0A1F4U3H4_UNCSA|nr:MAG: hypothetical protein A2276_06060 [candidate division WOR-1 bacterium RIFOXYA12_FULL_43_27]OGC20222.1 MAG: hypothetical protein A2292_04060 [candidate division WOR-1 bacterium RIFOXYB2_FULL_46_45]OGC32039.1 MAG: hypothetical protein A2232_07385 [candidate division WOR-1 bacterium RIFOXYA2_FULL_46_56]OGC39441.1 MAG: hypothetical protein A2438_07750 [candidate division WOR-1 bacterium RIFOXYC2_FULL_46_14]
MKLSGKSILVTGGAGFIGSHLVDRIIQESPANLVVVDNLFLGKEINLEVARRDYSSLKFYQQDAADYEAMKKIISQERIDIVFNMAVIPLPTSLVRPRWTVEINIAMTTVLCDLLKDEKFKTLIHFSSSEVYGSALRVPIDEDHPLIPCTPYAASKLAADHIVSTYDKTFGLDTVTVRPFNNFGPRQNDGQFAGIIPIVINKALKGEPITIYGDGKQTRDFVFVEDVVDATVEISKNDSTRGQTINLASGIEVAINDLAKEILDILQANVPITHVEARPGDVRRHCGGVLLAKKYINFQPKTKLREGLRKTIEWYKKKQSV